MNDEFSKNDLKKLSWISLDILKRKYIKKITNCSHQERIEYSKGMCQSCYYRQKFAKKIDTDYIHKNIKVISNSMYQFCYENSQQNEIKIEKPQYCIKHQKIFIKNQCDQCIQQTLNAWNCEHKNAPHYQMGLCQLCYFKQKRNIIQLCIQLNKEIEFKKYDKIIKNSKRMIKLIQNQIKKQSLDQLNINNLQNTKNQLKSAYNQLEQQKHQFF